MATKNIQMNILTDSGSYDTLYPQTTASQAGARPDTWMPTASQVGALPITGGTLTGDLKIKNSSNYGTTLSFGDGTYCQISEPTDDCMDIKAKKVNFTISDSSDSRFTINGSNPFGANGDSNLKYTTGSRVGTGTTYPSISLESDVTQIVGFYYKKTSSNSLISNSRFLGKINSLNTEFYTMITGDSSNGDCAFGVNFLYKGNSSGIGKNWLIYIYDISSKKEYYFGINFVARSLSFFNMFSGTEGWESIINHSDTNYSYLIIYY